MLTVHLRVNDSQTLRPVPVRVRLSTADGVEYPPLGLPATFPTGRHESVGMHVRPDREHWWSIDGGCEVRLPTEVPVRVQIQKGPAYLPVDREVTLGAGQIALRTTIERWTHPQEHFWFSGDARAHAVSPHAALVEAGGEDVDVVNLLAHPMPLLAQDGQSYETTPLLDAFSGQTPALAGHDRLVVVNTLNTHPVLGALGLLHAHRVVHPLRFGGDLPDDWSLLDWCQQCRRKHGLVTWVNAFEQGYGLPPGGEALIAAVLGKIDAIESSATRRTPFLPRWYQLLDAGVTLPLVGASGKDSNRTPLGALRTMAYCPDGKPLTYRAWIEAVRAGATYITNGPLLEFTVNGQSAGAVIPAEDAGKPIHVVARASSVQAFDRLELIGDGEVIASANPTQEGPIWRAEMDLATDGHARSWLALRCVGNEPARLFPKQPLFAHSSAVRIASSGPATERERVACERLQQAIRDTMTWVADHGNFSHEKWKSQMLAQGAAAIDILHQRLSR